ncbi:uncharacterized protein LOC120396363 isoform X2 [Mauremys reevesii]|nr:uncharacterized protein LOC120396363 isoform X2 [Mauremys reevesii]
MFRRPPDTGHLRLSTGSSRLAKVQDLHTALSSTLRPPQGRRLSDTKRDILHLLARQHTKAAVSILLQMPWPYERPTSRVKLKDVRSRDRRCFTMSCRERHRLSVSSEPRPGEPQSPLLTIATRAGLSRQLASFCVLLSTVATAPVLVCTVAAQETNSAQAELSGPDSSPPPSSQVRGAKEPDSGRSWERPARIECEQPARPHMACANGPLPIIPGTSAAQDPGPPRAAVAETGPERSREVNSRGAGVHKAEGQVDPPSGARASRGLAVWLSRIHAFLPLHQMLFNALGQILTWCKLG